MTDTAGGIVISLPRGALTVLPDGATTRLCIESPDTAALQLARDMLAERLRDHGLEPDWREDLAGRQPGNQSRATVLAADRISPSYSRVVIEGADLARFDPDGLHFRLLLGPDGAGWPETDAAGATVWPGGMTAWHRPVYTVRSIETTGAGTRIAFDVFRHDGGRVTAWCDRVRPGDTVALTGPGGGSLPAPCGWIGLVGDETAMPVMARALQALPAQTRGQAALFVPTPGDIQHIAHPDGVTLRWVMRGTGETPLQALRALDLPGADRHVFFAGHKPDAQAARAWLAEQGLDKTEFSAAAYWS